MRVNFLLPPVVLSHGSSFSLGMGRKLPGDSKDLPYPKK